MRGAAQALALLCLGGIATVASGAQRELRAPKELVERVGAWAEVLLMHGPDYTATETIEETRGGKKADQRVMVVEYTVRRDADGRIVESRKLLTVDGQPVSKKDESVPVSGLNNPFVIVSQLAERNQSRMRLSFAQDTSDADVTSDYVLLGYRQVDGEGLAELDGKGVYPHGQAWVDPNDGHIWRIEDEVEYKDKRYTTAVEFSRENSLQAWLPRQITARVFNKGRLEQQLDITYSGFAAAAPAEHVERNASSNKP